MNSQFPEIPTLALNILCKTLFNFNGLCIRLSESDQGEIFSVIIDILNSKKWEMIEIVITRLSFTVFYSYFKNPHLMVDTCLDCLLDEENNVTKISATSILRFVQNVAFYVQSYPSTKTKYEKLKVVLIVFLLVIFLQAFKIEKFF